MSDVMKRCADSAWKDISRIDMKSHTYSVIYRKGSVMSDIMLFGCAAVHSLL